MKRIIAFLSIGLLVACQPSGQKSEPSGASGTDKQATRIGDIALESGYPSLKSVEQLYDERDFQRACIIHNWGLPW